MDQLLKQSWWMLALRGVVAVLFGVVALVSPALALLWIVAMFAAYALLGGSHLRSRPYSIETSIADGGLCSCWAS